MQFKINLQMTYQTTFKHSTPKTQKKSLFFKIQHIVYVKK